MKGVCGCPAPCWSLFIVKALGALGVEAELGSGRSSLVSSVGGHAAAGLHWEPAVP